MATSARRSTPTATRSTPIPTTTRHGCRYCACATPTVGPLHVGVELPGRTVWCAVWLAQVGRVPLLLLDTDIPDNDDADRPITHILYVRGREMRLHQEIVLGVGGVRALRALGINPAIWHLNEGHSAFLLVERARELLAKGETLIDALQPSFPAQFGVHHPHAGLGGQRALRRRPGQDSWRRPPSRCGADEPHHRPGQGRRWGRGAVRHDRLLAAPHQRRQRRQQAPCRDRQRDLGQRQPDPSWP